MWGNTVRHITFILHQYLIISPYLAASVKIMYHVFLLSYTLKNKRKYFHFSLPLCWLGSGWNKRDRNHHHRFRGKSQMLRIKDLSLWFCFWLKYVIKELAYASQVKFEVQSNSTITSGIRNWDVNIEKYFRRAYSLLSLYQTQIWTVSVHEKER